MIEAAHGCASKTVAMVLQLLSSFLMSPQSAQIFKTGCRIQSTFKSVPISKLLMTSEPSAVVSDLLGSSSIVTSIANAWSVSGETLNSADFASTLFAASLFPYLAFLWFLSRPQTKTPVGVNQGFQFLLVFVFLTIPAGIYAKVQYHDILANVDYLHGGAESMLTITNLLIIFGFRATRPQPVEDSIVKADSISDDLKSQGAIAIAVGAIYAAAILLIACHPDPSNSLSIPTWVVHSSSLLEWLYAMKLAWEHANFSGNPKWRSLTWAMIPSHTSGICACTYHFFYNSALLNWIVSLQAGLTVVGNAALALAAYQIYSYGKENEVIGVIGGSVEESQVSEPQLADSKIIPTFLPGFKALDETNIIFCRDMFFKSVLVAVVVKYGELFFDAPFNPQPQDALALIIIPTLFNIRKWASRSASDPSSEQALQSSSPL